MLGLGAIGFLAPAVLAGLVALPVLWWLLRAIPPSPRTETFPGVRLLFGLDDPEREAERTPWWLLLLRILAIAAVILGFAQPILNPAERLSQGGEGPVLVLLDAGWASAPDWAERRETAVDAVVEAGRQGRSVILWRAADELSDPPEPMAAGAARAALEAMRPAPLTPDRAAVAAMLDDPRMPEPGETIYFHDAVVHGADESAEAAATEALLARLAELGPLTLVGPADTAIGLRPPRLEDGQLVADAIGVDAFGAEDPVRLVAIGRAPGGGERRIAVADAEPGDEPGVATARFDLPTELIGTIARVTLADGASPGGTALADAAVRRVPVAVVDPGSTGETAPLTSARHYLTEALSPYAEVRTGSLEAMVARDPAALFLADQGVLDGPVREALTTYVEEGGLLVRFAGPRLAGALAANMLASASVAGEDPLLPVRLRRGGRTLGGALAWGDPRGLGPFAPEGPFRRLSPSGEVAVRTQVLADPSPDLARKTWASLDDGTPFVTAGELGEGRIVLFHVSADAEWSSLPLSGLFVDMLRAVLTLAQGQGAQAPDADELAGTLWRLRQTLAPDGSPVPVPANRDPVTGELLAGGQTGPALLPGIYARADGGPRATGAAESLVLNLHGPESRLSSFPSPPA
ncbi:MAG: BatA domain-containing protein, partial [Pseudomonadota bacterium]